MAERDWPPRIEVGNRVHHGISSPSTGIVLSIDKKRVWARVAWDHGNGTRREHLPRLFSVTRSLTEWACHRLKERPCRKCGYRVWEPRKRLCGLCRPVKKAVDRG